MSPAQIYCLQLQNRSVDNNNNSNGSCSSNGGSNKSNSNSHGCHCPLPVASAAWAFCKVPTATRRGPDSCTPAHKQACRGAASKRMQDARRQRPRLCGKCNTATETATTRMPHLKLKQPPSRSALGLPAFLIEKPDHNLRLELPNLPNN